MSLIRPLIQKGQIQKGLIQKGRIQKGRIQKGLIQRESSERDTNHTTDCSSPKSSLYTLFFKRLRPIFATT